MYPILLEFGFITVFSLWFFVAVGFVVGSLMFVKLAKRYRIRLNVLFNNSFALFISTLVAARLVFVILNYNIYFYQFHFGKIIELIALWDKGLSFWGAIFAWFGCVLYFSNKEKDSPMRLFDIMIPSLFVGMFFGNIGAFLEGINYGTPTGLPWGLTFRSANVKYISEIHPTQLYAALYVGLIAVGLFLLLNRLRDREEGLITELGVFAFGVFKFLEEFMRGDDTIKIFSVRLPQILAAAGIIIFGYMLYKRYKTYKKKNPSFSIRKFVEFIIRRQQRQDPLKMATTEIVAQSPLGRIALGEQ